MGLGDQVEGSGDKENGLPAGLSVPGPESLSQYQQPFKDMSKGFQPEPERAVVGRKMGIIVVGPKHAGKSTNLATLPRPNGGKTVFLSFDDATWDGLVNTWGEEKLSEWGVEVWHVTKPVYEKDGDGNIVRDKKGRPKVLYPGYDATKPATSKAVLGYCVWILDKYLKEGTIVDNVVLDFWQGAHKKVGVDYCRAMANIAAGEKVSIYKYAPRAGVLNMILSMAIKLAQHCYVVTGYEKEFGLEEEEVESKDGKTKTKVEKVLKDAMWIEPYQEPFLNTVRCTRTVTKDEDGDKVKRFYMEPLAAKSPIFPDNETVNVTGEGVGRFWELYEERRKMAEEVTA